MNDDEKQIDQHATDIAHELRARGEDALRVMGGWQSRAAGVVRDNPAACLLGAFVLGFALAKVARHV
jgi:hypothetical protein